MNAHASERTVLCGAIDTAIQRLTDLRAKVYPASIYDTLAQAESAEAYSDHVREIEATTGDLRVAAIDIAASLGNQFMCDGDRRAIRECDLINDILSDVQDWCDEVREDA